MQLLTKMQIADKQKEKTEGVLMNHEKDERKLTDAEKIS